MAWRPGGEVHRLGQPALCSSQWSSCASRSADRVRGEELGADPLAGRLPRHRLGAVLAELGGLAAVRVGPGARGQSKPSTWFIVDSVCAARLGPISPIAYFIDQ